MKWSAAKVLIRGLSADPNSHRFSDAQLAHWGRATMNSVAEETRYFLNVDDSFVGAESPVTLPDDVIQVRRVETDQDGRMRPVTTQELWESNRNWRSRVGTPRFYYLDSTRTYAGVRQLGFYDSPSVQMDYLIYYDAYPQDPDSVYDAEMEIPKWAAHIVVYGVLARAYEAEDRSENHRVADMYRAMYASLLDRLKVRSYGRLPKRWVAGTRSHRRLSGHELFPANIPEP